jgi:hypothetical protein
VTHVLTLATEKGVLQTAYDWIEQHAVLTTEAGDYRMYKLVDSSPEPSAAVDSIANPPTVRPSTPLAERNDIDSDSPAPNGEND